MAKKKTLLPRSLMAMRTKDWFRQAEKALEHARKSETSSDFEWACFAAQQAADLLIIADGVLARSLDRYALFADDSLSIDVEPRVFTTKEFL